MDHYKIVRIFIYFLLFFIFDIANTRGEDGYRLWLRYDKIQNESLRISYSKSIQQANISGSSSIIDAAKSELKKGLDGLLGKDVPFNNKMDNKPALIVGTPQSSFVIDSLHLQKKLSKVGNEGYLITNRIINRQPTFIIAANKDVGILYGSFHFLRLLQSHHSLKKINIYSKPKTKLRVLNHWYDVNVEGSTGPGYGGAALWDWRRLPDYISPRYKDYARANASIGINGVVLTNVSNIILRPGYLKKVAALANVFRPYGIKVYLGVKFNAPIKLGGLSTADPLNQEVQNWWKNKVDDIYTMIPNFGGLLVKADSEGQPGPFDYNRSHSQGANMLADVLSSHDGVVMWRAFVYSYKKSEDRAKQAYSQFKSQDGKFRDNVLLQIKNGPIDFQPREPFHPLFGAMPSTSLMIEFQINQEYLGWATHLVYLAPLYKEVLESDTYAQGKGSTVAKVVDGSLEQHQLTGMAGIANIGKDLNWCGGPFAQSNWYAFGRLAWDHTLSSAQIADEWIRMTFSNDNAFIKPVKEIMLRSREISVDYRTPLGLYFTTAYSHYGPAPWKRDNFHKADSVGIGVNRTISGSNAVSQYSYPLSHKFNNVETTPNKFLLWFHHVPWNYKLNSDRTLWQSLVDHYYAGLNSVRWMEKTWNSLKGYIDRERYYYVKSLLKIQETEARYWRDACVLYFQTFSRQSIPDKYEKPKHDLQYYENPKHKYVPGL